MKITLLWICVTLFSTCFTASQTFHNIKSKTPIKEQELAVKGLISRLLRARASEFSVVVDPTLAKFGQDAFTLQTLDNKLVLTGTTGVSAAWAFNHYLKYYCKAHISWSGNQLETIPKPLPIVAEKYKVVVPHRFRYYQNVCTSSYSFVWWNWTRWEQEIDWMALNGINLPLAFTAQETIWQRLYLKLDLTQDELNEHFGGAAFLAWSRMGNVDGWGGPLPNPSWYQTQLALQHRILKRMRSFGMTPVLPAFAGHIPKAIKRVFPNATVSTSSPWGHFNPPYEPTYLLDPGESLFQTIGEAFIAEQISEYNGTDHVYSGDMFNEMTPKSSSTAYLSQASRAVYDAMVSADEKAIWLMQGWLFVNDPNFWQPAQVEAYLKGVPLGKMIVLDLYAEISPVWRKTNSFFGQPFIWCMLHNFGGNIGMHGVLQTIATEPVKVLESNNSMIGIGITPEGIETNYVLYDLMLEMGWRRQQVETQTWLKDYTIRRYGAQSNEVYTAWEALRRSVYNDIQGAGRHCRAVPIMKPTLNLQPDIWYDPNFVLQAWDGMFKAAPQLNNSATFRYDLVDVTRQALQVLSIGYYNDLISSYKTENLPKVKQAAHNLLDLIGNMDLVLLTNRYFLLGRWLNAAKRMAASPTGKKLLEFNARNQITTWGPRENIEDYANKMWSGLLRDFYKARWQTLIVSLIDSLTEGKPFNQTLYNEQILKLETRWNSGHVMYPEHPHGDTLSTVTSVYQQYRKHESVLYV